METVDTNYTVINYSIHNMIEQKITIWNKNHISGYLINKNDYYLFQPHNNYDELLPLYYRNNMNNNYYQEYIPLEGSLFEKNIPEVKVYTYDETISKLTNNIIDKGVFKDNYSFDEYIDDFQTSTIMDIHLDNLLYEEKVVLLKSIVKEMIKTKKVSDKLRKRIFEHFKNNLIYQKKDDFLILKKTKDIIGFFLMDTNKLIQKRAKGIQELEELENDYSYFIYRDNNFYEVNELGDGNLIKMNIKTNFLIIKDTVDILKTDDLWGYPFKTEDGKLVFKLVYDKLKSPNKLPGRIISQISKKNSLRDFIRRYFSETYDILKEEDPDLEYQTKHFLYLLIEMIIRNKEKNTKSKHVFIPYDLVFLKYIN